MINGSLVLQHVLSISRCIIHNYAKDGGEEPIQNSRIYQIFSFYLAIQPCMLILVWFGIKTVMDLCIQAVKLYVDSKKYGEKELKSYQIYPCHLIL